MFSRMSSAISLFMITGLLAMPAAAVDLDTVAWVNVVEGITITEVTPMNFGDVALNTGTITLNTDGTLTDPDFLSFDAASVSQGIFTLSVIAGSSYDINIVENVQVVGLTLDNFQINIDGAANIAGANNFLGVNLPNAISTLNLGGDLTVDAATASLGDNQSIGYRVSVDFN
jgi:hypothetical protein